ncbi:uncharacterized protein EV422DRAFT_48270 [Fimicolochytrium jonesii]|uniref:uncharacterized protein n=1 Tax=Fimicolochytrium jonesii TaxID=1396493 RepID=UPI0022FEC48F|nr:uncharacterized protein EV422DRAFT_48270 [Fimicolochytrium jonesii]KAI8820980.1 hypothetical protein EV422DRAFT_48270 [Fimicolochytrium jonesii]
MPSTEKRPTCRPTAARQPRRYLSWFSLLIVAAVLTPVTAFYLPGVAPKDYREGDVVALDVNVLTSKVNLEPYDYYYEQFHHPRPPHIEDKRESLGSILFGDRMHNSLFQLKMLKSDTSCKQLGSAVDIDALDAQFINARIKEQYQHSWFVDGLPAAEKWTRERDEATPARRGSVDDGDFLYKIGFAMGLYDTEETEPIPYLNNHYDIEIQYHQSTTSTTKEKLYRVVGVIVSPRSVLTKPEEPEACRNPDAAPLELSTQNSNKVQFTYFVQWVESSTSWGTRWDHYLKTQEPQIHWFSIINSVVIVLMLTGMIAMILLRALHKDIARYNTFGDEDGGQEDFGWKLVHADVFRPPSHRMLLSVLLGNGAQLACMAGVTLVFAVLGFLSMSSRGSLSTVALIFYICFASVAGYVSARTYKMLQGEMWKRNVFLTGTMVPGLVFGILVFLNFFLIGAHSSAAVPFSTMLAIIALWFLVSLPACMFGAYFGFKAPAIQNPVKTNQIPRQIPPQPLYLNKWIAALIGGILPFGAIFIELWFIMNSIWEGSVYYVFGFLFLVFVILVVTCSEVAILMCYFHLCSEDYYWPWRAFLTSGASGFYVFMYSIVYYFRKLELDNFSSKILYFGWSLVLSSLFFILTGAVGFFATLVFVRKIFAGIKVD